MKINTIPKGDDIMHTRSKKRKANIDDGMNSELVIGASFDGYFGIPIIKKPEQLIIPNDIIPFSKRKYATNRCTAIGFYEADTEFANVLISPHDYIMEFCEHPLITPESARPILSPDCSLYRNAPLAVQIANIYRNRAIGYYYQKHGAYVIPQVRWGNELTYTTKLLPEKVAFLGVEKHSIVAVGNYGCFQTKDDKYHFEAGLASMMESLEPEIVLVYGSLNEKVFGPYLKSACFKAYPDWITHIKGGGQ